MVPNIILLQSTENAYSNAGAGSREHILYTTLPPVQTLDGLGEELVYCCEGLHVYQVRSTIQIK